ncbi:hypothetical protein VCHA37P193_530002 [Vibrio chagasii]|nr:hypothetical protein VCHA41O249_100176 [Vibrio chagasii]CAH7177324.1 hypothetical protein VCHA42O253_120011 [Vibrio chagasii]CAH7302525.1 hypothetical protein VCHA37P193_530002 [Vibrio chagasii]
MRGGLGADAGFEWWDAKRQTADTKGFRNEYQAQVTLDSNLVIPYSEERAQ